MRALVVAPATPRVTSPWAPSTTSRRSRPTSSRRPPSTAQRCSRPSPRPTTRCSRSTSAAKSSRSPRSRPRSASSPSTPRSTPCSAARRSRTAACSRCSTRSSTTCRRRSTCPPSRRTTRDEEKVIVRHADATSPSRPSRSRSRCTRSSVASPTSACTPVTSTPVARSSTRPRARRSASARSSRCTPTRRTRSTRSPPVTSTRSSASRTPPPVTRSATRSNQVVLESMTFPEPVIEVAIEPKTKADQEKLGLAIQKLAEEDPTFRTEQNQDTGQTVIKGMGELHLDILVDRMKREFNVEANVGKPQVAYRETIKKRRREVTTTPTRSRPVDRVSSRRSSSRSSRSRSRADKIYEFENKVTGGRIPREYIPSIEPGLPGRHARRRPRRLPDGRRQGDPARRCCARRRLLGDGVQDRRLDGLQGSRSQGEPRSARAAHGRRGAHPRGVHGRRHRRPELASRSDPVDGGRRSGVKVVRRTCRCRRCSATSATCGRRPRVARCTRWSSTATPRFPKAVADEIVQKNKGE